MEGHSLIYTLQGSIYFHEETEHKYVDYGCCEYLGDDVNKSSGKGKFFIGLPIEDLSEFFKSKDNLSAYCEFLSLAFDVEYRLATPKEIETIENNNINEEKIFIFANTKKSSNKRFVASYTLFRYVRYHVWENVAITTTNLYKLNIFEDLFDILAIANSYQVDAGRTLLPVDTMDLPGLLYFRSKNEVLKEVDAGKLFNDVFYKYPIYFDPQVTIRGSFFDTFETVVPSKSYIRSLQGIMSTEEVPAKAINTFMNIKNDYLVTKQVYLEIFKKINEKSPGFLMDKNKPLLLSLINIESKKFAAYGIDVTGNHKTLNIEI